MLNYGCMEVHLTILLRDTNSVKTALFL